MSFAQTQKGVVLNAGIDRIGIYVEAGAEFGFKRHNLLTGIRYYGPDYVFESQMPGLSLRYQYILSSTSGNWYFAPGVNTTFFYEPKSTSRLFLTNVMVRETLGYFFKSGFGLHTNLGLGAVINRSTPAWSSSPMVVSYLNYEVSLGIAYRWSRAE